MTHTGVVVVFEADETVQRYRQLLQMAMYEIADQLGAKVVSCHIENFNPEHGSPVFYIP